MLPWLRLLLGRCRKVVVNIGQLSVAARGIRGQDKVASAAGDELVLAIEAQIGAGQCRLTEDLPRFTHLGRAEGRAFGRRLLPEDEDVSIGESDGVRRPGSFARL